MDILIQVLPQVSNFFCKTRCCANIHKVISDFFVESHVQGNTCLGSINLNIKTLFFIYVYVTTSTCFFLKVCGNSCSLTFILFFTRVNSYSKMYSYLINQRG